jgi:ADP-ribose pyrophosphatase
MPKDQPNATKVTSGEVVFEGKIWDVRRETFEFGDQSLTRDFIDHPGAVAVLAINELDQVLMIRQYRHPVGEFLWEIPAGLLDVEGESELLAAERELLEETGYRAALVEPLLSYYTSPGGSSELKRIFVAKNLEFVGRPDEAEGEERELIIEWIPFDEVLEAVLTSEIKNPSAVVAILAMAQKRKA